MRLMAMQARKEGLSEGTALSSITDQAAENLGLSERIGTLEAGYEANMTLFDGDPLDFYARVSRVWIKGEEVYRETAETD